MIENKKIVDVYSKRLSKNWTIIDRSELGIKIKKYRSMNKKGFWIGLILLPFWGIGLIFWFLTLLDYILQQEKIKFVTVDQMVNQLKAGK